MNELIKASVIRADRTICPSAIATNGTSYVLEDVNLRIVASASILAGILSVLTSIANGLPEADYAEYIYMDAPEPDDAEVVEDEDEE